MEVVNLERRNHVSQNAAVKTDNTVKSLRMIQRCGNGRVSGGGTYFFAKERLSWVTLLRLKY